MADITPEQILGTNYTADATTLTISLADLLPAGELTSAEAAAGTGNGSKVAYALLKTIHEKLAALDTADQPDHLSMSESNFTHDATNGVLRRYYTAMVHFPEPSDLADE